MSRKQPWFHVFGWKASTDARPFYSTAFSKRQYFTLAASIEFPAKRSQTGERMSGVAVIVLAGSICGILDLISASALFLSRGGTFDAVRLKWHRHSCLCVFLGAAPKHTWIERAYNAYLEWSGARAPRSRLVSTPRDRLQYKNSFEEGALLRLQKIQIHAPCKPLAA
jgi:hypothetical protein